jgi:hypothetical protein
VVLCIGLQGNLRKLGVPGEDLERVQYQLDDPDEYNGETIVVVGAGDAGIENALALAENNRVILINRVDEFPRVKQGNIDLVTAAIRDGKMECRYSTSAAGRGGRDRRRPPEPSGATRRRRHRVQPRDRAAGAIPPRKLVESFGAVPSTDHTCRNIGNHESNVPAFTSSARCGYPLITGDESRFRGRRVLLAIRWSPPTNLLQAVRNLSAKNVSGRWRWCRPMPPFKDPPRRSCGVMPTARCRAWKRRRLSSGRTTIRTRSSVDGEVMIEVPDEVSQVQDVALGASSSASLARPAAPLGTVRAGANCVLIEMRRSMLKLIARIESVRRQVDGIAAARGARADRAVRVGSGSDEIVKGATTELRRGAGDLQGRRRGRRFASQLAAAR